MRKAVVTVDGAVYGFGVLLVFVLLPARVTAEPGTIRSRSISLASGRTAQFELPERWVQIEVDETDVVALFRLKGGRKSQIDIRTVELGTTEKQNSYLSSFHARLKEKGFVEASKAAWNEGRRQGTKFVYGHRKPEFGHRLLIWHWKTDSTVLTVTAFIQPEQKGLYREDVQRMLETYRVIEANQN